MIVILFVMITGCSNSKGAEEISTGNIIDMGDEPSWAMGTQMKGKLFQNLNLDGIGEADDEVYVSVYQFGDYEDKATIIRVRLGTGETMAQILPVYGDYSLLTGKLFSLEKDAVILEVRAHGSNYGAATVLALDVFPVDADPIPTVVKRLDTTESIMLADGNVVENSALENGVTFGTEVVDVEDMPCQGLSVYFTGEKGQFQEVQRIFYWTDSGWTIISEKVQE